MSLFLILRLINQFIGDALSEVNGITESMHKGAVLYRFGGFPRSTGEIAASLRVRDKDTHGRGWIKDEVVSFPIGSLSCTQEEANTGAEREQEQQGEMNLALQCCVCEMGIFMLGGESHIHERCKKIPHRNADRTQMRHLIG